MKEFNYSIICEDIAHYGFIEELLKIVSKSESKIKFNLNSDSFRSYSFRSRSSVLGNYVSISERWFSKYKIDLLFVIVDFDDWKKIEFKNHHDKLQKRLKPEVCSKSLILLPVRAIEFWLYHLKWKSENPTLTKKINIESWDRKEVKKLVYGTKRADDILTLKTVIRLMADFDHAWLCSRSDSFNHFYANFKKFIKV